MATNNAYTYFVDRNIEKGRGDNVAFREVAGAMREITYASLSKECTKLASALQRDDIRREERVAVLILDQIEYPVIFWGCLKAGVIPVLLNTLLATPVYSTILQDCRASCLVVSQELLDVVLPAAQTCPYLKKIIVIGDSVPEAYISYSAFIASSEPCQTADTSSDDTAFWLYSSGSTGQPKGVRHVHSSLKFTADTYGKQVLNIQQEDTVFSAAKIFFAYGLGNSMTFPMSVGATALLFNVRPTPEAVVKTIKDYRPTIFFGVPTLYAAVLLHLERVQKPDSRLRICVSAGEALPADIGIRWKELWSVDILDGVGSTEMLHIFLTNSLDDVVYGTSGFAVPGYKLRCVNDNGEQIKPGEVGEMLVNGDSAADGYWNQRAKSRDTFEGVWTKTGDKYEIAEDGRYIYCGRTDDMFKVSGIWVSPFEIEQALIEHSDVLEAAVVAFSDADGLTKPKAFIVLSENVDLTDFDTSIKEFVKNRVGKWKYPRWIEFVSDLPKTATGKIQRFKLRDPD